MKRFLLTTFSFFGLFFSQSAHAASYTHTLNYTTEDFGTLTGRVTFDSSDGAHSTDQGSLIVPVVLDQSLITDVTFTYTDSASNSFTITYADITHFAIDHKTANTDYSVANLKTQLNNLQFISSGSNFELGRNNTAFTQSGDVAATEASDFNMSSASYHSPGPLPLFGVFTAFASIKKLKRKYKLKYSF